jgi:hypothetical protein
MFQPVQANEAQKIIQTLLNGKVSFIGRTNSKTLILAKSKRTNGSEFKHFSCEYKSNKPVEANEIVTFSFVCFGKKYLFNATCFFKGKIANITPTTELFFLQRRNTERLIIPDNYYAVLKITHINSRIVRTYVKITNISIGGCGISLKSDEPKIATGDVIKGLLHFSSRPPLDIEGQIRHIRIVDDGITKIQNLGILFLPTGSVALTKKLKIIVMDIYRDLFSEK